LAALLLYWATYLNQEVHIHRVPAADKNTGGVANAADNWVPISSHDHESTVQSTVELWAVVEAPSRDAEESEGKSAGKVVREVEMTLRMGG